MTVLSFDGWFSSSQLSCWRAQNAGGLSSSGGKAYGVQCTSYKWVTRDPYIGHLDNFPRKFCKAFRHRWLLPTDANLRKTRWSEKLFLHIIHLLMGLHQRIAPWLMRSRGKEFENALIMFCLKQTACFTSSVELVHLQIGEIEAVTSALSQIITIITKRILLPMGNF